MLYFRHSFREFVEMRKLIFAAVGIGLTVASDYLYSKKLVTAAKVVDAIGKIVAIIGGIK